MNKRLLSILICSLCISVNVYSQGFFSTGAYTNSPLGVGATGIFGWGENFDRTFDIRPNPNANFGTLILNYHTGLTFSAHSVYGGIRFYNQGYPNAYDPATGAKMVMSIMNGYVGVNTTNPTNPLTVGDGNVNNSGSAMAVINTANANTNGLLLSNWIGSGTSYGPKIAFDNSTQGSWVMGGSDGSNNFDIARSWGTPDLRINAQGNVGINTADTKGYMLAVNGSVIATSITVKLYANWADYVFNPTYHLIPLSEVKTYIDQNHHLPGMPSAAEVKKDGVNLGETNRILTQKVEELTLYLIEQQKQIDQLRTEIKKTNYHNK